MTMQYEELGNLISIAKGRKAPKTFAVPVPDAKRYIQINDLRSDEKLMFADDPLGVDVMPSDLCIAWDGANAGTIGFGLSGIIGSTIARLRPKKTNLFFTPYVGRFLKSKFNYLNGGTSGATIPHVSKDKLTNLRIPLPSLPEQRRIAAILDKADAVRRKRQESIRLTEEFLRSVFLDMFGDPVSNPKEWKTATIRDLVTEVKYGTSEKASYEGNFPILRMNNITYEGGWDFSDIKRIDIPEKEVSKYMVQKGDILFNRTNSKELVGKTAVYRRDDPMAYAGYLIRIKPNKQNNSEYIAAYLNSKHGKVTLEGMCKSIVGMANINAQELQDIKILKPPTELQNRYGSIVQSVERSRETLNAGAEAKETLFNSLVQRAFRGEL